jgi:hypothetical protein
VDHRGEWLVFSKRRFGDDNSAREQSHASQPDGVVQETRANPLEQVTYRWTTHFFEGIGETNLVLEPPSATSRDGVLGSNSLFPKAYLYTQGDKLEWRF